jgi:hypothetical protein
MYLYSDTNHFGNGFYFFLSLSEYGKISTLWSSGWKYFGLTGFINP